MIQNVRLEDVRYRRNGAVSVISVVVPRARYGFTVRNNVDFCLWVLESQEAAGNDRYRIQLVIHASKVRYLSARVRLLSKVIGELTHQ